MVLARLKAEQHYPRYYQEPGTPLAHRVSDNTPILDSLDLLRVKNLQDYMESYSKMHPTHKCKT